MENRNRLNIAKAKGLHLDVIGGMASVKRRHYWWIFKESNWSYRRRIARAWLGPGSLLKRV